jgi:hypothetical protein
MKNILLVAALLAGGIAQAGPHGGGFHGGGGYGGGGFRGGGSYGGGGFRGGGSYGGGNFHSASPVVVRPSYGGYRGGGYGYGYGYRAPAIVVAPPRIYVAPRYYPPTYSYGYAQPQWMAPPLGTALSVLPQGAVMQVINGATYATYMGAWFFWDGSGMWISCACP